MKTVKQPAEVLFKALDFADKVVMLPLMNMFAAAIRANMKVDIMITEDMPNEYITPEQTKKIFKLLSDLGCRTSLGESYEDIIKSDNSQENTPHFLTIRKSGKNEEVVEQILSEELRIPLKEAQAIVLIYPITIDLRKYTINSNNYQQLLGRLASVGADVTLTKEQ